LREELPVLPAHPVDDRFGRDRTALRLPEFLRRTVGKGDRVRALRRMLRTRGLHTVCEEAKCPNLAECFAHRTATFMIMGKDCTRACGFCAVGTARPGPLDADEPRQVAEAAAELDLAHVVITSVNRDDLDDGGSGHFRATVEAVRARLPEVTIEVLTPDFCGDLEAVRRVARGPVDVFNHNVETVPRLQSRVRPRASYARSLAVLETVAREHPETTIKSGFMVGLGETVDEIYALMDDLKAHGVDIVTVGQYLRPSLKHVPVMAYLEEKAYDAFVAYGREIGLGSVFAGPFVRSSYHAAEALREAQGG
jgi:lipoic acid synthetase